jgi:hypothetical protein
MTSDAFQDFKKLCLKLNKFIEVQKEFYRWFFFATMDNVA